LHGAKTKALRKENAFPLAKISSVMQHAHVEWSIVDKEVMENLIEHGLSFSTNATAFPQAKLTKKP